MRCKLKKVGSLLIPFVRGEEASHVDGKATRTPRLRHRYRAGCQEHRRPDPRPREHPKEEAKVYQLCQEHHAQQGLYVQH